MHKKVIEILKYVLEKVDRPFFPILMAILSALDHFVLIIPSDGILVTSVFIRKKKWLRNALFISLGSTLGALLLVLTVHLFGLDEILSRFPAIAHSKFWPYSQKLLEDWGLWGLFIMMVSPFMQQPMLLLIGLTHHHYSSIIFAILAGKSIKYFIMSWVASKFPEMIRKSKLLGEEVKEVLEVLEEKGDLKMAEGKLHKNEHKGDHPILP